MRHMPAECLDEDAHSSGVSEKSTRSRVKYSRLAGCPDVKHVRRFDSIAHTFLDQHVAARDWLRISSRIFLRSLENEADVFGRTNSACEYVCECINRPHGAEKHRRMAVVSASMHLPGNLGRERKTRFFLNRQGVHIGSEEHSRQF